MLKAPISSLDIETSRTIMRPHTLADFNECAAMWADPEVTRYISGRASNQQDSWARHLRNIGHWTAMGFGFWVVRDKTTEEFLGEIGYAVFHRTIEPKLDNVPEMGWVFCKQAHGKGLATETTSAAAQWADRHFSADKTLCIVAPEHAGSIAVAQKLGFQRKQMGSYMGEPSLIMERPRSA